MAKWKKETAVTEDIGEVIGWKWCPGHHPPQYIHKSEWTQRKYQVEGANCKACGNARKRKDPVKNPKASLLNELSK
jgi:hypothetical protein